MAPLKHFKWLRRRKRERGREGERGRGEDRCDS